MEEIELKGETKPKDSVNEMGISEVAKLGKREIKFSRIEVYKDLNSEWQKIEQSNTYDIQHTLSAHSYWNRLTQQLLIGYKLYICTAM